MDMVRAAWTGDDPWLAVAPGSPAEVRDARSPRATPFPDTRGCRPFADDLSHVAHLEAQRYAGHRLPGAPRGVPPVAPPAGRAARPRRAEPPHRRRRARRRGGVRPAPTGGRAGAVAAGRDRRAVRRHRRAPAVLDCTGLDLRLELPDLAVFTPPPGDRLHYLDRSVDVVVVEVGGRPPGAGPTPPASPAGVWSSWRRAARVPSSARSTGGISRRTGRTAGAGVGGSPPRTPLGAAVAERVEQAGATCWSPRSVRTRWRSSTATTWSWPWSPTCSRCPAPSGPRPPLPPPIRPRRWRARSSAATATWSRRAGRCSSTARWRSSPARRRRCGRRGTTTCARCAGRRGWWPPPPRCGTGCRAGGPRGPGLPARVVRRRVAAGRRGRLPPRRGRRARRRRRRRAVDPARSVGVAAGARPAPGPTAELSDGAWRHLLAHDDVEACRG